MIVYIFSIMNILGCIRGRMRLSTEIRVIFE